MNPIELKILFHNDETAEAKNLEQDIHPTDFDADVVMFYNISNIRPMVIDDVELTSISSDGEDFICITPYEKLKERIAANNKKTI